MGRYHWEWETQYFQDMEYFLQLQPALQEAAEVTIDKGKIHVPHTVGLREKGTHGLG